jgi:Tol biopolymer transport system component
VATATAEAATAEAATRVALFEPTSTGTPVARRGELHEGAWVRVNAGAGDCLNARNRPSIDGEYNIVYTCLPDGFEGYLTGNASPGISPKGEIEPGGRWWWYLAGTGWVAEEYLTFVRDVDLSQAQRPELAGAGRIAYVRENDVWLMNADGSDQRKLLELSRSGDKDAYLSPRDLTWSPDGTMLSFNISRWADGGANGTEELHVVTVGADGSGSDRVVAGVVGAGWSPDSTRIGIVREPVVDGMGGGAEGVPAMLDVRTGGQVVFGSERFWQQRPPAFNFDGTMLLVTYSKYDNDGNGASRFLIWDIDGTELARIEHPAPTEGYYAQPRWAPNDNRIAFHASMGDRPTYEVYDVDRHAFVASAPVPKASDKIGGGCGGADMWRMDWSLRGDAILYSFSFGDTGANGVWAWDLASGEQRLVPAASSGPASPGTPTQFAFTVYGETSYIFIGDTRGGFPRILAEGASPAWSPTAR